MSAPRVGPILIPSAASEAVIAAIRDRHDDVRVEDQGGYLRVSCPAPCRVSASEIEARLGSAFRLPSDLEAIMPSFQGKLVLSDSEVSWQWRA
ncbi:MAG: MmoB/DmpM family protein [Myxococcota bacterium]